MRFRVEGSGFFGMGVPISGVLGLGLRDLNQTAYRNMESETVLYRDQPSFERSHFGAPDSLAGGGGSSWKYQSAWLYIGNSRHGIDDKPSNRCSGSRKKNNNSFDARHLQQNDTCEFVYIPVPWVQSTQLAFLHLELQYRDLPFVNLFDIPRSKDLCLLCILSWTPSSLKHHCSQGNPYILTKAKQQP